MSRARTEYRYEKLTWPEINEVIADGQVCIVPCGAVEQHGPHLPFITDTAEVSAIVDRLAWLVGPLPA